MTVPASPPSAAADGSRIRQRLTELGLELPSVAAPVAAYVPAVRSGDHVLTSGQLPFIDGSLPRTGKVGAEVTAEQAAELAATSCLNALAAIEDLVGSLDQIVRVVKLTGFVASDPSFTGQPAVINGASELLGEVFGERGAHARSAVGVAVLPMDAPVELELQVEIQRTV
ncbi:RidA family protein [Brachybacterium muris]|uniref:LysR family transcriptional regulator n=1 Tax=Brachybacterium muris UCD-AY4 TaxID=1249481 RepID=A0A022KU33_9MICO|nr:RidA family protein [Brachybacterium muris]PZP17766.1 MAG: RidA family protein [Brachybacterium faecium]EYT49481.1 LysR family transcriptional regulator [Brachybacterium muris UCD-AY4]MBM7501917.1 enamine deaminase RidA (YjgF/YER057c/UK114 family) [Brachybacterium muris]MCT1432000.1 RidA family protein [Brachybacterium muris]MCT1655017.1 RidA family protein [Brachybacterium muris]